jgi:hypothetical protein
VRTFTGTDLIDEPMKKSGSFGAFVNCLRLCPAVSSDKIHSIRCKTSSQRQTRGIPVDHVHYAKKQMKVLMNNNCEL